MGVFPFADHNHLCVNFLQALLLLAVGLGLSYYYWCFAKILFKCLFKYNLNKVIGKCYGSPRAVITSYLKLVEIQEQLHSTGYFLEVTKCPHDM